MFGMGDSPIPREERVMQAPSMHHVIRLEVFGGCFFFFFFWFLVFVTEHLVWSTGYQDYPSVCDWTLSGMLSQLT